MAAKWTFRDFGIVRKLTEEKNRTISVLYLCPLTDQDIQDGEMVTCSKCKKPSRHMQTFHCANAHHMCRGCLFFWGPVKPKRCLGCERHLCPQKKCRHAAFWVLPRGRALNGAKAYGCRKCFASKKNLRDYVYRPCDSP